MLRSSRDFQLRSTYNSVQKSYSVLCKKATSGANSFKTYEIVKGLERAATENRYLPSYLLLNSRWMRNQQRCFCNGTTPS